MSAAPSDSRVRRRGGRSFPAPPSPRTACYILETARRLLVERGFGALVATVDEIPPGEERVGAYIAGLRTITEDVDAYRAFFQIAPHALRDPELRSRMAKLYEWYREVTLQACGVSLPDDPQVRRRLLATAGLVLSAVDGLALQVALDPAAVDDEDAFDLLGRAVQRALTQHGNPDDEPEPSAQ